MAANVGWNNCENLSPLQFLIFVRCAGVSTIYRYGDVYLRSNFVLCCFIIQNGKFIVSLCCSYSIYTKNFEVAGVATSDATSLRNQHHHWSPFSNFYDTSKLVFNQSAFWIETGFVYYFVPLFNVGTAHLYLEAHQLFYYYVLA